MGELGGSTPLSVKMTHRNCMYLCCSVRFQTIYTRSGFWVSVFEEIYGLVFLFIFVFGRLKSDYIGLGNLQFFFFSFIHP